MRISTQQVQQLGIDSMLNQQTRLSKTQIQVASGKRVLVPSDDPVATTEMLHLKQSVATTTQYKANAEAAINRLTTEDGVLEGVTNILQRVRELALQGNNGTQTNETRRFIAAEVRQRLDELVGLANSRDGTGDYLFSGSKGSTEPFARTAAGTYTYSGDQSVRPVQVGSGRQIADGDHGAAVFQLIRNGNGTFVTEANAANTGTGVIDAGSVQGNFVPDMTGGVNGYTLRFLQALPTDPITWEVFATGDVTQTPIATGAYTENQPITVNGARFSVSGTPVDGDTFTIRSSEYQDMFQTLENLASSLEQPVNSATQQAQLSGELNRAISDIDQALGNVLVVRSSVGSRLNAIDSQQYVNDGFLLQAEETLSSIQDLDYADAISRLHLQIAGLEAAQQAYLKVNGLSMFNYLR